MNTPSKILFRGLLLATCGLATGCNSSASSSQSATTSASATPAPWAHQPAESWPQLVLTNQAEFKGHTGLQGASSFIVRLANGKLYLATAKHLIGSAGGVEPKVAVSQLDDVLLSWRAFPRTDPGNAVRASGLATTRLASLATDWLVIALAASGDPLPATPLTLRPTPVKLGERVHLIGCPYSQADCKQNVYSGKVTRREGSSNRRFRFTLEPPVEIAGFSGAPIIDDNGLAVGVMTLSFAANKQGPQHLEAGAEDSTTLLKMLTRINRRAH